VAETAERLSLSREMGALIAGVSLSTFPYALDVTAKVTTLRDFFITLFFVALGMTIPLPNLSVIGLALLIAAFTVISRLLTTFTPLYLMKQGLRASLLPAINLAQISEFSLVVIQTGVTDNHIAPETANAASFAFVVLAVLSTFVMVRSDEITRRAIDPLKRIGLRDLDHHHAHAEDGQGGRPRRGPAHPRSRLLPRRERPACGDRTAESAAAGADYRGRFQPECVSDAAFARPARDLRRHQQCRHAGACRRRQVRDGHPQHPGRAP